MAACVKEAGRLYDIPIALHVDHCPSYQTIVQCIQHGYTSVMIDGSMLPYDENVALVKRWSKLPIMQVLQWRANLAVSEVQKMIWS